MENDNKREDEGKELEDSALEDTTLDPETEISSGVADAAQAGDAGSQAKTQDQYDDEDSR